MGDEWSSERALLDEQLAPAFVPFDDWQSRVEKS
jgi:hypothetical protein